MTRWNQKRTTDVVIRAAGALCCTASYLAVGGLMHLRAAALAAQPGVLVYALAAIAFLGASVGAALALLGHHIFDQIEVSGRWQHRPSDGRRLQEAMPVINRSRPPDGSSMQRLLPTPLIQTKGGSLTGPFAGCLFRIRPSAMPS